MWIMQLLMALSLGALIGLERQLRDRMAGLRTNGLVALGAAVFIIAFSVHPTEAARIAAQIVSGVGFLGAGVILREGLSVRGINTAATLWCSAGVGTLCGLGRLPESVVAAILVVLANIILRALSLRMDCLRSKCHHEENQHFAFPLKSSISR